jgi:16S rRNA (guanine966-N2)-methyltransferase
MARKGPGPGAALRSQARLVRIIAGRWKSRRLRSPRGRDVRPTTDRVREAWMSALGGSVSGATVLDLFAGSGALGLESLSRGAESVIFVDRARSSVNVIRHNVELLGAQNDAEIVCEDVFRYLQRFEGLFDIALADPPYEGGDASALVKRFEGRPFAKELWLEHPVRELLSLPEGAKTRRYGDTALTTLSTRS